MPANKYSFGFPPRVIADAGQSPQVLEEVEVDHTKFDAVVLDVEAEAVTRLMPSIRR